MCDEQWVDAVDNDEDRQESDDPDCPEEEDEFESYFTDQEGV